MCWKYVDLNISRCCCCLLFSCSKARPKTSPRMKSTMITLTTNSSSSTHLHHHLSGQNHRIQDHARHHAIHLLTVPPPTPPGKCYGVFFYVSSVIKKPGARQDLGQLDLVYAISVIVICLLLLLRLLLLLLLLLLWLHYCGHRRRAWKRTLRESAPRVYVPNT